jgi:hypothetical protein
MIPRSTRLRIGRNRAYLGAGLRVFRFTGFSLGEVFLDLVLLGQETRYILGRYSPRAKLALKLEIGCHCPGARPQPASA